MCLIQRQAFINYILKECWLLSLIFFSKTFSGKQANICVSQTITTTYSGSPLPNWCGLKSYTYFSAFPCWWFQQALSILLLLLKKKKLLKISTISYDSVTELHKYPRTGNEVQPSFVWLEMNKSGSKAFLHLSYLTIAHFLWRATFPASALECSFLIQATTASLCLLDEILRNLRLRAVVCLFPSSVPISYN